MNHEAMTTGRPKPFITAEAIAERIAELGQAVSAAYPDATPERPLALVSVLKGAAVFTADLMRSITLPCTLQFISASSYGSGTASSGRVEIGHALDIEGREVLLVEDIVDTGLTLLKITETLRALNPRSIRTCTLLDKPSARIHPVSADFVGFSVPDRFLIGYGIDLDERYRELPYLALLDA